MNTRAWGKRFFDSIPQYHREELQANWRQVGVGVVGASGKTYLIEDFIQPC